MSFSAWLSELNRILLVFVPCGVFGIVTGYFLLFFVIGLIIYGLWTARQLVTLKRWLDGGAIIDEAPEFLGLADQHVSSIVDLQKHSQTKQNALKEFVEQFNEMIAALPDAVVVMTASGEILSSNQAAQNLLQIHPTSDKNTRITQLVRNPIFTSYFTAGKFDKPLEVRGAAANEPELNIRIISFGENRLVLIAQDMTHAARIYEMRRSFILNASHELRTPLTVILGYLETLSEHRGLPDDCKSAVQAADLQAQRMKQLVEDLLTLSRLESAASVARETDVVPIASLITEVVKEAQFSNWLVNHNVQIQIETDVMLKGKLREIHSLISNLVTNAIKHTEVGTNINVIWRRADENSAELVVEDNGQGIAPEDIERLTERFYRVDTGRSREKGGTGLGLSIVKHIVERHEGKLDIASQLGQGAVFTCSFPNKRLVHNGEKL